MKSTGRRCWSLTSVLTFVVGTFFMLSYHVHLHKDAPRQRNQRTDNMLNPPATHRLTSLADDYHQLINLTDFTFQILANCSQDEDPLVVVVHSAPTYTKYRNAIRATWGSSPFKVVFMLGAVTNETLQRRLEDEGRRHGDLVQGSFNDSYRNLTYKHVMALKWLHYHCQGYKYALKTDDDVFVKLDSIVTLINNGTFPESNHIVCDVIKRAEVKRSWRSKWRVSPREFHESSYPTYCPGWIVLYSQDVIGRLYTLAQKESYFWVDDVHITGILAQRAQVNHKSIKPWRMPSKMVSKVLKKGHCPWTLCREFAFGSYELEPDEIKLLWTVLSNSKNGSVIQVDTN
ncbi:beta-1,3-galactosyltransferase 5-like [Neocloeon triangulifer]|uniref:beta-1,3-galactosyltransferase 5-like n=1 Tax=Neocloeon triangulifer TaxID=2078957 RepID=UPI00286F81CB|nr:beta-1,3-galactosyltransferase 5-like [Neocloeon triangulifer]